MGDDRHGGGEHMKERHRGVRRTSRGGQSRTRTREEPTFAFAPIIPNFLLINQLIDI